MDVAVISNEKKKVKNPDRLAISPESMKRMKAWRDQILNEVPGIKVPMPDLLDWMIRKQPENLSQEDIQDIGRDLFDEVKFAQWAVRELKTRRARGEELSLLTLIAEKDKVQNPVKTRKNKIKKEADESPPPGLIASSKAERNASKTLENKGISLDPKAGI